MKPTLYEHQAVLKRDIYAQIREGNRKVMCKAPTGFGKTVLLADIIHDAVSKGIRVIFTVPTLTLIDQTLYELTKFGLDCGVIQADHFATDYSKKVQIASVQTIASQLKRNNKAQMFQMEQYYKDVICLIDEAHLKYKAVEWLINHTSKPCIAASATPWAKGLGLLYDSIVHAPDAEWLIDNGYMSPFKAYSHFVPDMKGVQTNASGDYSSKQSGEKYDDRIIGDIVSTWKKHANGKQTILFAPRVVDAERFAAEFNSAGISAVAVSGYMDNADCRMEVDRFKNHEITVICSVAKLTTGFDVKDVGCIIDVQPTKSLMRHVQKLGRGLRPYPDKELIILDNAGNLLRNGLPDADFPMHLDMGEGETNDRRTKDEALPKECIKCHIMKPPKVHICPACGFKPEPKSQVEIEQGGLVELKSAMAKRNRDDSWDEKVAFMAELNLHAENKKYKRGWVVNQYKARYSVLPWDGRLKGVPPAQIISEDTQKWIISRQIAWANRRAS